MISKLTLVGAAAAFALSATAASAEYSTYPEGVWICADKEDTELSLQESYGETLVSEADIAEGRLSLYASELTGTFTVLVDPDSEEVPANIVCLRAEGTAYPEEVEQAYPGVFNLQ